MYCIAMYVDQQLPDCDVNNYDGHKYDDHE